MIGSIIRGVANQLLRLGGTADEHPKTPWTTTIVGLLAAITGISPDTMVGLFAWLKRVFEAVGGG